MPAPPRIHPSAVIDPEAEIAADVQIGPFVVIDGPVQIGEGTIVRPHAHLIGPMTIGARNDIGTGVVLGDRPQHLLFKGQTTGLVIGDGNVFREHAVAHRGFAGSTVIGNYNYFMTNVHIGHDCIIGNNCLLASGCLLAGHGVLQDRVLISGNAALHQFARIGRLGLLSGLSASTKDIPPFLILTHRDRLSGVNVIGMRRAGIPTEKISAVRQAFKILCRSRWTLSASLAVIEQELGHVDLIQEFLTFIRESKRGVVGTKRLGSRSEEEAA